MYNTRDAFEAAVRACNPPYTDRELASIEVAWNVYQAAQQSNLNFLVLGRWVTPSTPGNPGIDRAMQENLHITDEVFTGGAIMNSNNWTMLVNDAFLLGGIHSHTDFQLASPRTLANIYNSDGNYAGQMTVTGRELTALAVFGYTIQQLPIGEVGACTNTALADMADFATYRQNVDQYTNNRWWVDLVARH
jgi:hypothetical protein